MSRSPEEKQLTSADRSLLHANSGDLRGDDGDFVGALDDYKKALALDPASPRRLIKLAEGYAANDLHHKAFELYQRALRARDEQGGGDALELGDAYDGLGDLCRTFARSAAAVRSYERAVRARPKQPFLRWKLAACLITMGLYERAEDQLLIILEMAPRDAFYRFALADLYRLMGRDEEVVDVLEEVVELAPRDDYYRLRLGAAFLRVGRSSEALPQFQHVAERTPSNASYQTLLLYAFMRDNQEPTIAVDVDKIELDAYDEDFVNRIQKYSTPVV